MQKSDKISLKKEKTKKQLKEYYSQFRGDWGDISPVTKVIPNKKKNCQQKEGEYD